ncbi:MAG: LamG-like jellyroll fold domain-containing protein, partial [Bacteroidota bacterium]
CRKLDESHPHADSLVGYWPFEANSGTVAFDNHGFNHATFDGNPTWEFSGAALGDTSTHDYVSLPNLSLTQDDGSVAQLNNFEGLPDGAHLYRVEAAPNDTVRPSGITLLDTAAHYGVFVVGGTSPTYTFEYKYDGNTLLDTLSDESVIRLLSRSNNAASAWSVLAATTLDTLGNTISADDQSGTEYIPALAQTVPLTLDTISGADVTCNGFNDGQVLVSITGGVPPYSFSWSNGSDKLGTTDTTDTLTGLGPGNYIVKVIDNFGDSFKDSVEINEPPLLMLGMILDSNATCHGFADGGTTVSASGGTMPYTYNWSNGMTTASITGLLAGTYTVTATDSNGCTETADTTITEPALLMLGFTVDSNATCHGFADGGTTVSASGGTGLYTYNWSNGMTTASITGLVAGTYTVTVTDNNGCTETGDTTITEPDELVLSIASQSNVTTNGGADGTATTSVTGGTPPYTYAWSNGAVTSAVTGLSVGTYSVTVTDNNLCSDDTVVIITQPLAMRIGSGFALDFDGMDDQIVIPHDSLLNLPQDDFTLEAWVYLRDNDFETILSKGHGNSGTAPSVFIFQIQSGKIALGLGSTVSSFQWHLANSDVPTQTWTHVAVTYDAGTSTANFYLNGVADGTDTYTNAPIYTDDANDLYVGRQGWSCNCNFFDGTMDELRVWKAVLSETELRDYLANRSVTLHPQFGNMLAYYRMDQGSDTVFYDRLANHDGVLTNMDATTDWELSGAPLGDSSAHDYMGTIDPAIAHADGDSLAVRDVKGAPDGIHVYLVNGPPNVTQSPVQLNRLDTSRYYGVFMTGGTNANYTATYHYAGNPNIDGVPAEDSVNLAFRENNADTTWRRTPILGTEVDAVNKTISAFFQNGTEYVAGFGTVYPARPGSGYALSLDGNDDYVDASEVTFYPDDQVDDYTLEAWVRADTIGMIQGILDYSWDIDTNEPHLELRLMDNGRVAFYVRNDNAVSDIVNVISAASELTLGEWTHLAGVKHGSTYSLYVNGELAGSTTASITGTFNRNLLAIGARWQADSALHQFKGKIDEVRIWNRAIDVDTIRTWMCRK